MPSPDLVDAEGKVYYNGSYISWDRYRYEMARRQQSVLDQVNRLGIRDTRSLLAPAQGLGQQEMGGYLRTTIPGLVDRYGNVNATAAVRAYDEISLRHRARLGARVSNRRAAKVIQGQVYKARLPIVDVAAKAEPIIGAGMAAYVKDGFEAMVPEGENALTRAWGSYMRDAVYYNAGLDDSVITVQRVAEPGACAFCALMAFSSTASAAGKSLDVRTTSYAVDFHNHCRCTIETLYEGDEPIRPDYYDDFEQSYLDATREVGTRDPLTVLQEMRVNSGRK